MKINYSHLLIKTHYFLLYGSVGPFFPYLHVYVKQRGISSVIIGSITAILPILYLISKPVLGFIIDYFQAWRKLIFMSLLFVGISSLTMVFLLLPLLGSVSEYHFHNVSCVTLPYCDMEYHSLAIKSCNGTKDVTCHWVCKDTNFSMQLSFHADQKKAIISPDTTCLLNINDTLSCQRNITNNYNCNVICDNFKEDKCLYTSIIFWIFVLFMSLGTVSCFTFSSISDAVCFAMLGLGNQTKYGRQRLWGAIGYGVSAFLAGYMMDLWSHGGLYKTYTPSIIIVLIFACTDFICCMKLELSYEPGSKTILKDVFALLKLKSIIIFLCISTFTGFLNSVMRNFLFWYLEDLALETSYINKIKSIEGLIIAAQNLGGEVTFFFLSGKILKKFGYSFTFTFCFICYAFRMVLISLAPTPWWVLPIEFFMHGPSYALCVAAIVSYASVVAPSGTLTTVQGLVQSMNDGVGFSVGSLFSGIMYRKFGGIMTFRIFAAFAAFSALTYFILYHIYLKHETSVARSNIKWREINDAQKHCVTADI
ncbi:major facilitator superfamily domain-containing protein 6-A [Solenopsis invicta]|uniref:major facilitator superfamily domain-containing protein 6-A n=1 Tax=Solenopsis invicta TaxID=13686 RepID=UPI00193E67A5|nr:major facilitator superfamily domain-containing protein 6-A [Solenopsis invicta]